LRRTTPGADEVLRFADLELNPATREVRRGGDAIELTRTEFSLLELFLLNPRQVLTRSIIFERVWGYDFGFASNSLDVYIGYLRRKTEAGGRSRLIHTVRGVGYALRDA
jgi:two-component system response regulator MprA